MTAALATLLSIIAGLAGAVFGHSRSERKSRNDELAKLRLEAYTDLLGETGETVVRVHFHA